MESKEKIIKKFKEWLKEVNVISYDEEVGFDFWDKETRVLRDNKTEKEVYILSFKTQDNVEYNENGEIDMFTEGMYCFAYFDAETLDLIYIHKTAGYIEPDGSY